MTPRAAILFLAGVLAFAQIARDGYREAYKTWRQADPSLERDAGSAGPALGADADRVANEAAKYFSERAAFLTESAAARGSRLSWLEQSSAPAGEVPDGAAEVLAAEAKSVRRNIDTFANDPDPGMQQLRTMLERENTAMTSLTAAIAARHKAAEQVAAPAAAAGQARVNALPAARELAIGWKGAVDESGRQATAWADYYRTLSDGARGVIEAPTAPAPAVPVPVPPAPPAEHRAPITAVPLGRYTGAWTFPVSDGLFHGPEPQFLDLVVHEQDGHADGTLFGRFKATGGDPVLRFDFSGEFTNTRNQKFDLKTSDGSAGTIELIPGAAFNLLEINFQIDAKPGKIRQGNMVLVKK